MSDPQQLWGVGIGTSAAARAGDRATFVLERRHEDGHRWVELHRYTVRSDAESALSALIEGGAAAGDLRVRRVRSAG